MSDASPQPFGSVLAALMDTPIANGVVGDWRLSDAEFLASFHLPGLAEKHETLKKLNPPLPRDARISFNEYRHEYTIDGIIAPRSTTGLVHAYGWDFDPHVAVRAMKNGSRWHGKKREDYLKDDGEELGDDEVVQF